MADYTGTLVHPQAWPEDLDVAGKRIVVIGSGATAVTLVPALARSAAHVTMLQRSPTYVASLPGKSPVAALLRKVLPGQAGRCGHQVVPRPHHPGLLRHEPALPEAGPAHAVEGSASASCPPATTSTPTSRRSYNPWDQRFCAVPNGDLFDVDPRRDVSVVTDHIERFTEKGLLLTSGEELEADIIVTATGLELLFLGGIALTVDGEAVDPAAPPDLQGDDARGRPEHGHRHRVHQRLVDAQVRSHVRLRLPPAEPHARTRPDAVRAAQPRRRRRVGADPGADVWVHPAFRPSPAASRARCTPGRSTRAICATTGPSK